MAKRVKCSLCGDWKWMENKYFRLNLSIFKVENGEQLNDAYCCRKCRELQNSRKLTNIPEFRKVKRLLQQAIDGYISNGWNNFEAEMMCKKNVEAILADFHINPNQYRVLRNGHKITGIILLKIPFWDNMLVEIEWKDK